MPTFRPEEISLGKTLGTGGFGIVSEISKFTLDPDHVQDEGTAFQNKSIRNAILTNGLEHPQGEDGETRPEDDNGEEDFKKSKAGVLIASAPDLEDMSDVHFDIKRARHLMEKRCLRDGQARFALKRLHGCLSATEKARGMIDLAVEAKYLSVVWHPNISK